MYLPSPSSLQAIPKRIISLVPSQTELLYELGLDEQVVGITKFCIHPEAWFRNKTRVGGTKTINKHTINQLKPDLIIANKEENVKEQVDELALSYPVWVTDVNDLSQALQMIRDIGILTRTTGRATELADLIQCGFDKIEHLQTKSDKPKTVYLIWKDPYMAAGSGTFIHDMLLHSGLENSFSGKKRYPELTMAELQASASELVLLSSEPFPFGEKHIAELAEQLPGKKIMLVDGESFSWYGSRLREAPAYFNQLINRVLATG